MVKAAGPRLGDRRADLSMADEAELLREENRQLRATLQSLTADDAIPGIDAGSFTPLQMAMLALLHRRKGAAVSREAIVAVTRTERNVRREDVGLQLVTAQVCYIRKRLRDTGAPWRIRTHWAFGYSLVPAFA